ncbi:MAG: hypothetical protein HYX35_02945 [Proteobacteria bacterium]|nr:hypothetical protein [Pseudomonadota bacterium]
MLAKEKFVFFQGTWTLERTTNGFGKMQGTASFFPFSDQLPALLYREEGTFLTPQANLFDFYKEYIYFFNHEQIEVYFASGETKQDLFLSLTASPKDDSATGTHLCEKDLYLATYRFLDNDTFTLHYDVKGPKKDLKIETYFKRDPLS